ncbi:MAG: formylglycine-generating enzyme family protein [Spirochaetes bacterium]|nr:formylglycine-generating enzyme family protein [Spirochaetota bacterium]
MKKHLISCSLILTLILSVFIISCDNSPGGNPPPSGDPPGGPLPIVMVQIPPSGTAPFFFRMGQADITTHEFDVTLTQGFRMSRHQITQAQWEAVMTGNTNGISPTPSHFRPGGAGSVQVYRMDTSNFPVERVNWFDALVFCNRLSIMEGLDPVYSINGSTNPDDWGTVPTGSGHANFANWNAVIMVAGANGYRLPTEAQWEFACRAGTTTPWNTGNNITQSQANFRTTMGLGLNRTSAAVGSYAPNAWGFA